MRVCSIVCSILLVLLMLWLPVGCASGEKDKVANREVRGVTSEDATEMNARRNAFESSEDPPINANTRFAAGQLAESHGALPQAIKQYAEAVKIDPKHQGGWFRLGVLYTQTKQFPKAIGAWEQYIKLTNGDANAYSNLGYCHELQGNRDAAEAAYRKGVARDPRSRPCRVNFGLMLARAGREAEALEQFQAVLTPAEAHYNLGSVYEHMNRREQAKAHFEKALELDPQMSEAQQRLAQMK